MRKFFQITLITGTSLFWVLLAFLLIRQRQLLNSADPLNDTGLSFGYTFLTKFAPLALLGFTAIVLAILGILRRNAKRSALLQNARSRK